MRVVKNINNNVSVCIDDNNRQVIAFGKGIGFKKPPYEVSLGEIDRTFYELDENFIALLEEIPEEVFEVSCAIVEKGSAYLNVELPKAFVFTLADHLNFAIERTRKGMVIQNPMINEIRHLYEKEMKLGNWAIKYIRRELKIALPQVEAGNIVMHFINAESLINTKTHNDLEQFIDDITMIIEDNLNIIVDRNDFSYSRFVTHLKYLLKRSETTSLVSTDNKRLYSKVREEYPELQKVIEKIKEYLIICLKMEPNEEELLYLMLHINRLYSRESL